MIINAGTGPGGGGANFVDDQNLYVSLAGNNTTGTGSANNPYATIQKALDVFEADITNANWYKMRTVHIASGLYDVATLIVPPGRITLKGTGVDIKGSVVVRRNSTLSSGAVDPLTGGASDRLRHTIRFEGGAGFESGNYDGGIHVYGAVRCSQSDDSGTATLDMYARNTAIAGTVTASDSTTDPVKHSGSVSMYFAFCRIATIHTPLSGCTIFLEMSDCRITSSIISHPNAATSKGEIRFGSIKDCGIANLNISQGEVRDYTSGNRQAWCNTRFNTGTAFTAASARTLKMDAHTAAEIARLVAAGMTITNVTIALEDQAHGMKFTAATSGNWNVVPVQVKEALDELAARVKALETP